MTKTVLGIEQIRELMPHRFPMALVDRVIEVGEKHVIAEKLVSANEPFFQGHFPDIPIMPGVLIVEALAQASGLGILYRHEELRGMGVALVGMDKFRFRRPVVPGDVLSLRSDLVRRRGNIFVAECAATVLGESAAKGEVMAAFMKWEDKT